VSLRCCPWWAEKLPDNVTCGEGCEAFPACLPQLELVRVLTERAQAQAAVERERRGPAAAPDPACASGQM
jgi:hypothetical protein